MAVTVLAAGAMAATAQSAQADWEHLECRSTSPTVAIPMPRMPSDLVKNGVLVQTIYTPGFGATNCVYLGDRYRGGVVYTGQVRFVNANQLYVVGGSGLP